MATTKTPSLTLTNIPEGEDIAVLREKAGVSWPVFAGVCSANGWKPGKQVSAEEFDKAVKKFLGAPIDKVGEN